jgi:hypothetical protein
MQLVLSLCVIVLLGISPATTQSSSSGLDGVRLVLYLADFELRAQQHSSAAVAVINESEETIAVWENVGLKVYRRLPQGMREQVWPPVRENEAPDASRQAVAGLRVVVEVESDAAPGRAEHVDPGVMTGRVRPVYLDPSNQHLLVRTLPSWIFARRADFTVRAVIYSGNQVLATSSSRTIHVQ